MSVFTPVYRPRPSQRTPVDRARKRKRDRQSEGGWASPEVSLEPADVRDDRSAHPVSLKDPYYVARHPREQPLPGGNFPHAVVKGAQPFDVTVCEELAHVKPPIDVPRDGAEKLASRRRHIDNLTAVLHKCMLAGDWPRAFRAWSLLIRTEIDRSAMDVRRHERWGIGAELLLRRSQEVPQGSSAHADSVRALAPAITDSSFKRAREYYDRLILEYPHRPRSRDVINASVFYPALFSVWTYEVQERSRRARERDDATPANSLKKGPDSDDVISDADVRDIRSRELEEAQPILQRLDEILSRPPYDTSPAILRCRGLVGLWISNLHRELAENFSVDVKAEDSDDPDVSLSSVEDHQSIARQHRLMARREKGKTQEVFKRMVTLGMKIPDGIAPSTDEDESSDKLENEYE